MSENRAYENRTLKRAPGVLVGHRIDEARGTRRTTLFLRVWSRNARSLTLIVISTALLASCGGRATVNKARSSLTLEALENATYRSEWARSGMAKLTRREYREKYTEDSASELVISLTEMVAFGDLDGDGQDDAAAVLLANPGGSGSFYYLAAVINRDGKAENVDTELLGDRVKIKTVSVKQGDVAIDMIVHGPDDPLCCPSERVVRTYGLREGQLIRLSEKK